MPNVVTIATVNRREFLLGASAAVVIGEFVSQLIGAGAKAQQAAAAANWQEAFRKVVGDAKPVEGQIKLELPEVAENGNTVPFTATVDSPMTAMDYCKSLFLFATANPVATIATFHFTPLSGRAMVASRIRLAQSQDIVVLAQHASGRFVMQRREVRVTIGGCGG